MAAARRRFTQEFKDELCREVISTSKPIKDVATAYGVGPETLRNWLNKYREANGGTEADLTVSERARLKELEREVQELRAETAFLKKSQRLLRAKAEVVSKYEYIDSQKSEPTNRDSVVKMGRWLAVSTSGVYHWAIRPQSATAARREALIARIQHFFEESDGTYGYRRIHRRPGRRADRVLARTGAATHAPDRPRSLPTTALPHHHRSRRRGSRACPTSSKPTSLPTAPE